MSRILVLWCLFVMAASERGKKEARFFSFNYEERDITVDLDFTIPFISIPIKKTMDSVGSFGELPAININPGSLVLGGALVLGTTIVMPFLMKNYITHSNFRYSRVLDNTQFGAESLISFANNMLNDGDKLRGCTQRMACWAAQAHDPAVTRMVYQFAENKLLSSFINSTAIEDAVLSGRYGRECNTYNPCPIQENQISKLFNSLSVLLHS